MAFEVFCYDCGCEVPLAVRRFKKKHGKCHMYEPRQWVIVLSDKPLPRAEHRKIARDFVDGKYPESM